MTKQQDKNAKELIGKIMDLYAKNEYENLKKFILRRKDLEKSDSEINNGIQAKLIQFREKLTEIGLNQNLSDAVELRIDRYLKEIERN